MGMIEDIKKQVAQAVSEGTVCTPLPEDEYTDMAFPSLIKLMKFRTDRYSLEGFGRLMVMHTTTKMGMELLTLSFMPSNGLNVPYLLYEDFSAVGSFSYDDQYSGGFNSGSKDSHAFLSGWTGARIGASAGQSIRIACRRETSADYPARVDAAPLNGIIKSPVDLSVEFDYGANNQFGGISIISNPDVGQTCHVGYVTSTQGYKSGATNGTFEDGNSFYVKEYSGSYTSTPNTAQYTIHNVPAGGIFRLTIRTEIEHQAGTNNTTAWLYIDNVKIKIAK
jgi:hypothetical protein